eukprot:Rhum_TRINITY_DN12734_c0_g2::Rhum_TRINITY_DN12734_c0_g2_i1::g.54166::m.54166
MPQLVLPAQRRQVRRAVSPVVDHRRVAALLQEVLHDVPVSALRRHVQQRPAVLEGLVHALAALHQHLQHAGHAGGSRVVRGAPGRKRRPLPHAFRPVGGRRARLLPVARGQRPSQAQPVQRVCQRACRKLDDRQLLLDRPRHRERRLRRRRRRRSRRSGGRRRSRGRGCRFRCRRRSRREHPRRVALRVRPAYAVSAPHARAGGAILSTEGHNGAGHGDDCRAPRRRRTRGGVPACGPCGDGDDLARNRVVVLAHRVGGARWRCFCRHRRDLERHRAQRTRLAVEPHNVDHDATAAEVVDPHALHRRDRSFAHCQLARVHQILQHLDRGPGGEGGVRLHHKLVRPARQLAPHRRKPLLKVLKLPHGQAAQLHDDPRHHTAAAAHTFPQAYHTHLPRPLAQVQPQRLRRRARRQREHQARPLRVRREVRHHLRLPRARREHPRRLPELVHDRRVRARRQQP